LTCFSDARTVHTSALTPPHKVTLNWCFP